MKEKEIFILLILSCFKHLLESYINLLQIDILVDILL